MAVNPIRKLFGLVALILLVTFFGFYVAAMIGDYTGWYRVEDYMCMSQDREGCERWIAEKARDRERERQNRPPAISNPATRP